MTTRAEFLHAIEKKGPPDKCWPTPGKTDPGTGRGRVANNGTGQMTHRVAWEILKGPIPAGKIICHHCDNGGCLNPSHMYVGTPAENTRDMIMRNRAAFQKYPEMFRKLGLKVGRNKIIKARGEDNCKAKLTEVQVRAIRKSKTSAPLLALKYKVSPPLIYQIKRGVIWKHI